VKFIPLAVSPSARFALLLGYLLLGIGCSPPPPEVHREPDPQPALSLAGARQDLPPPVAPPAPEPEDTAPPVPEEPKSNEARKAQREAEWAAEKARTKARRRGKKTGLGSPDEKPDTITEELVRALGRGKVDIKRFLDPERAVFEMVSLPGASDTVPGLEEKHLWCGKARREVTKYLRHLIQTEDRIIKEEDEFYLTCDDQRGHRPDPDFRGLRRREAAKTGGGKKHTKTKPEGKSIPITHISCSLQTGPEWSEYLHIEWVPDRERGWRIAAIVTTEVGDDDHLVWEEVASALVSEHRCD
jgi:hypothetical protein